MFNHGLYENVLYKLKFEKDIDNNIYKNISEFFIEHLKDEKKQISEIIYEYFKILINQKKENINLNNDNKSNNNIEINNFFADNLSCIIIEFFS